MKKWALDHGSFVSALTIRASVRGHKLLGPEIEGHPNDVRQGHAKASPRRPRLLFRANALMGSWLNFSCDSLSPIKPRLGHLPHAVDEPQPPIATKQTEM